MCVYIYIIRIYVLICTGPKSGARARNCGTAGSSINTERVGGREGGREREREREREVCVCVCVCVCERERERGRKAGRGRGTVEPPTVPALLLH